MNTQLAESVRTVLKRVFGTRGLFGVRATHFSLDTKKGKARGVEELKIGEELVGAGKCSNHAGNGFQDDWIL